MENLEQKQFETALELGNSLVDESKKNFVALVDFLKGFPEKYQEEEENLPDHINIIDEMYPDADENAHSRFLAQLLRYKGKNDYPFLQSFLKDLCKFDKINIKEPKVEKVDSCGRIDIPIFDKQYVIIIENKVTDKAPDQNREDGGQLARYIDTIRNNYNRNPDDIFVVYMPRYNREPPDECWKKQDDSSYKDVFKDRFCSLSYWEIIYPWLKNKILPTIDVQNTYLRSAVQQYVDYLEGERMFKNRNIYKKMDMELNKFFRKQLELDGIAPQKALEIVSDKIKVMSDAQRQLSELMKEIRKELFVEWADSLKKHFQKHEKDIFNYPGEDQKPSYTGVILKYQEIDIAVQIEYNSAAEIISYGIATRPPYEQINTVDFSDILSKIEKESLAKYKGNKWWYFVEPTSFKYAYTDLVNLIERIDKKQSESFPNG